MQTIQLTSIIFGDRARTVYNGIEALADDIVDKGLIEPLILNPDLTLHAGGRRTRALQLLEVETLYYGVSSHPAGMYCPQCDRHEGDPLCQCGVPCEHRPLKCGYIFTTPKDESRSWMIELAENLNRHDLDWRDQVKLLVKAWRKASQEAAFNGEALYMRTFGSMIGVAYSDMQGAVAVHDDLVARPERYKEVDGIRGAYAVLLRESAKHVQKVQMAKSLAAPPAVSGPEAPKVQAQIEPGQEEAPKDPSIPTVNIALTKAFFNMSGLDFLEQCPPGSFDHIVTDPDYALSLDVLSANSNAMDPGVAQPSVEDSIADLRRLMPLAFRAIRDHGFFIFFYDLDHHNTLQEMALSAGFHVQRWPLTWRKLDYRSNAAPNHNFPKNQEWAMVCRKHGTILNQVQTSSVFDCDGRPATKEFGHPFAKPPELWRWIYRAIAIEGQVVFDPFVGSGTAAVAAAQSKLRPMGCEINPDHYANLILNLQLQYRKLVTGNVTFS